jgi:hypothetical protein
MTSASVRPGADTEYAEPRGHSLLIFAAMILGVLGSFNLLHGIAAARPSWRPPWL